VVFCDKLGQLGTPATLVLMGRGLPRHGSGRK